MPRSGPKLLALVLAIASPALAEPDIRYTMQRGVGGQSVIVISTFPGDPDGTTEIALEKQWGGNSTDERDVESISATGADGKPLSIIKAEGCSWSIAHDPGEGIRLTYNLREPAREPLGPGHNDYRNRIRPDLFQMNGNHGILYPGHLADGKERAHTIEWRGFDLPGFHAICSFGPNATESITTDADTFRHSLFIAGKLAYAQREINGNQVGLVVSGDDWGFSAGQLADLAARIIKTQRDFFDDHSDPWYLISITPEGKASASSFSLGGTALTNCFALYCNAGLSLAEGSPHIQQVYHVLAHEYFHTWNGIKFHLDDPEGSNYWFSEGFTEYFTRRMLRNAGLWDDQAVLSDINRSLAEHDGNPRRNAPNEELKQQFWTNADISRLPYRRGDLLALAIDEEIRRVSSGRRSLDDVFREMIKAHRDRSTMPNRERLLAIFEQETSKSFMDSIRSTIETGADLDLPRTLTEFDVRLTVGKMQGFDPGFDQQASHAKKQLVSVKPGSGAAKAGLADGMPFRKGSIGGGNGREAPKGQVEVQVDGQWKTIDYEAVGPVHEVRAYKK